MLVERSEILIKEGSEADFAAIMAEKGLPILTALDGVNEVRFGPGVENPGKFLLLIEWETMDAHTAFTQLPVFNEFRALFAPYSIGGTMEHFDLG